MEWTKKARKEGGLGPIDIPLVADVTKTISDSYGVLSDAGIAFRGSFIIDDQQIIRHISVNDLSVGRNVDEYKRLLTVKLYSSFRLFNILLNMEKSALLHGLQDQEQCLLAQKINWMLIGRKSTIKNDPLLSLLCKNYLFIQYNSN